MNKKILIIILAVLSIICCAGLVACNDNAVTSYKVEYIVNDTTYCNGSIQDGVLTNMPQDPEIQGYVFDGWYLDNDMWKKPLSIQALLDLPLSSNNSLKIYAKFVVYTCDLDNKAHSYTVIKDIKATCVSGGQKVEKCDVCGHERTTSFYPLQHSYSGKITTPAKCDVEGVLTYACTRENCNASYTQPIKALQHNFVGQVTTPAKCDIEGVMTYTCMRENCNASYMQPIKALQHDFAGQVTTPAKCDIEGVMTYTCMRENCDHTYTQPIDALQHEYTNQITTQPTCITKGVRTFTCTRNDCNHSYTESIEELQHSFSSADIILPCVTNGLREYTCTREHCGYSFTEVLKALGYHDCDKNGNCIRCSTKNVCSKNFGVDVYGNLVYNGNDDNVIIPSMFNGNIITFLGNTFSNNQTVQTVYIPDTVEYIGTMTFYCCLKLKSIRMSANIKYIGSNAFCGPNISSIYIPKTVEEISMAAFSVCPNLTDVYYEGSEDEWDNISIGGNNNALVSANITYNYIREE